MLELKNICKTYKPKKGVPVQALKNVSIKFTEKGMVFILGKSGCGKSTLLNCIGGLDRFDSGELIIKGKSSKDFSGSDFDAYRNTFIGFIFQEYNILSEFNVEKNVALALELQGKKATHEKVQELLRQVDLEDQGKRKTNELSGGQKQRIAIARALIKDPEIIIADEPTGALDSATGKQVFDTLKKLSQDKLVIIVSHDREFAENYADRIIEMKDGVIISDETKRHIAGQKLNDGVSVIGDDVIHIKAGHTITQKEVEFITKYIQKRDDSEAFISLNPKTNNKFREIAKIDENNSSEKFEQTTGEDLVTKVYDRKDLKLIKSRLKFKDSFKMGASGLKAKPIRLFFTILLSFIAFCMFGLMDTASAFNAVDNTVSSIKDSDINYLSIIGKSAETNHGYSYYNDKLLSDSDIANLSNELDVTLKPVYNFNSNNSPVISLSNSCPDTSAIENSYYYTRNAGGIVELTENQLKGMGCNLIAGRYPQSTALPYEILITKYQLELFEKCGYREYNNTGYGSTAVIDAQTIKNDPTVLLDKKIITDKYEYKIVGIIDTAFNSTRYESLKKDSSKQSFSFFNMMLNRDLDDIKNYSIHNLFIVTDGTIKAIKETGGELKKAGEYIGSQKLYFATDKYGGGSISSVLEYTNTVALQTEINDYFSEFESNNNRMVYINKLGKPTTEGKSISLYVDTFYNLLREGIKNIDDGTGYGDYDYYPLTREKFREIYGNYAIADVLKITDTETQKSINYYKFSTSAENNTKYSILHELLTSNDGIKYVKDNPLLFQNDVDSLISLSSEIKDLALYYSPEGRNSYDKSALLDCEISGFFAEYAETERYFTNTIIAGEDFKRALLNQIKALGFYKSAIGAMPTDTNKIKAIATYHNKQTKLLNKLNNVENPTSTPDIFVMTNEVTQTMDEIVNTIDSVISVLTYLSIGFCVFASLMLMNFIATSISYKKREIGILRALGSKRSDVFGVFFNESLIIAFINFVLASVACGIVCSYLNQTMRQDYGIIITVFNFGLRQLGLILFVSVAVAFISSLIPVTKIANKQPIDAINNR